jgi:hypothetical protein
MELGDYNLAIYNSSDEEDEPCLKERDEWDEYDDEEED